MDEPMLGMRVLAVPMGDNDAGVDDIGGYLMALAWGVWTEEEGFSGKRPFGNSGWKYEVYTALAAEGMVEAEAVPEGDRVFYENIDRDEANRLIRLAVATLAPEVVGA